MERICPGNRMIYPGEAPGQSVPESDLGCYQYGASNQDAECPTESLHHLRNEEKRAGRKAMKVLEVRSIHYLELYLEDSSKMAVHYELDGKPGYGTFKYQDIKDLDGTQRAVEKFGARVK